MLLAILLKNAPLQLRGSLNGNSQEEIVVKGLHIGSQYQERLRMKKY